jgi:hypothetical protein
MTADVRTEVLIESLKAALECPQKAIARLINVTEHTLTNNKDKPLEKLSDSTREKLSQLYNIVRRFACLGLKSEAIFEILESHVHEDYLGRLDSISSAISQQKYSEDTLTEIADRAYGLYQESQQEKFQPLEPMAAHA